MKSIKSILLTVAVGALLASCSLGSGGDSSAAPASSAPGTSVAPSSSTYVPASSEAPIPTSVYIPGTSSEPAPIPSLPSTSTPNQTTSQAPSVYSQDQSSSHEQPGPTPSVPSTSTPNQTTSQAPSVYSQDQSSSHEQPASSSQPATTAGHASTAVPATSQGPAESNVPPVVSSDVPQPPVASSSYSSNETPSVYGSVDPDVAKAALARGLAVSLSQDKIAVGMNVYAKGAFQGPVGVSSNGYGNHVTETTVWTADGSLEGKYAASVAVQGLRGSKTAGLKGAAYLGGSHDLKVEIDGMEGGNIYDRRSVSNEAYFANNVAYLNIDESTAFVLNYLWGVPLGAGKTSIDVGEGGEGVMPLISNDFIETATSGLLQGLAYGEQLFPSLSYYKNSEGYLVKLPVNYETVSAVLNVAFGSSEVGQVYANLASKGDFGNSYISLLYNEKAVTGANINLDLYASGLISELYGDIAEAELPPEVAGCNMLLDFEVSLGIKFEYGRTITLPDDLGTYQPYSPVTSQSSMETPLPSEGMSYEEFMGIIDNFSDPEYTSARIIDNEGKDSGLVTVYDSAWSEFERYHMTDEFYRGWARQTWDNLNVHFVDSDLIVIEFWYEGTLEEEIYISAYDGYRYPCQYTLPIEGVTYYFQWGYADPSLASSNPEVIDDSEPDEYTVFDWVRELISETEDYGYTALTIHVLDNDRTVKLSYLDDAWAVVVEGNFRYHLSLENIDNLEELYNAGELEEVSFAMEDGKLVAHYVAPCYDSDGNPNYDVWDIVYDLGDGGYATEWYEAYTPYDSGTVIYNWHLEWGYASEVADSSEDEPLPTPTLELDYLAFEEFRALIVGAEDPEFTAVDIVYGGKPYASATIGDDAWEGVLEEFYISDAILDDFFARYFEEGIIRAYLSDGDIYVEFLSGGEVQQVCVLPAEYGYRYPTQFFFADGNTAEITWGYAE